MWPFVSMACSPPWLKPTLVCILLLLCEYYGYIPLFLLSKDMSQRTTRSPVAAGRTNWKHFMLNAKKKVQLLMKLEKHASVK
jgi:hypothetical protein